MKKIKVTYEQAVEEYKSVYGEDPTFNEITDLYHRYANEWRHFDGFIDWLAYHAA